MPNEKKPKTKCVEYLRHAEYYDMQSTFDELYARSQAGEIFENLMDVILSRENILLAYRNIKSNTGSITPGTDKLKISDIGKLTADEVTARVRKIVKGAKNGYTPRSVRRKDIPKQTGIPGHWESLVSGIDWYSNVSSRSWNLSAKPGSATIAMDSVQIGRLKMR